MRTTATTTTSRDNNGDGSGFYLSDEVMETLYDADGDNNKNI